MLSDQNRPVIEATLPVVGRAHRGDRPALLPAPVRRPPRAARRHVQPGQPGARRAAAGAGRLGGRVRQRAGQDAGAAAGDLLSRIAHKHASLGIRPDQYQVVHDNLMWAIVDVLGDAVTPEVAAAWDEVYWLMANALINQERGLYSARGVRPETVWRPWEVEKKIRETDDVVTFVVRRIDDRLVKTSLPGQYVTVQVPMPDGVRQPRQYSLTRADDGEHRQFSVKRVHGGGQPDGEVSNLLHDTRRRRRRADHVAALRRRRARRLRAPGGVRQRRHRHRPDGRHALAPGRRPAAGCRSRCCTPTSTRPRSPCAARSSPTSSRCATRRCTCGTRTRTPATSRSPASTRA